MYSSSATLFHLASKYRQYKVNNMASNTKSTETLDIYNMQTKMCDVQYCKKKIIQLHWPTDTATTTTVLILSRTACAHYLAILYTHTHTLSLYKLKLFNI